MQSRQVSVLTKLQGMRGAPFLEMYVSFSRMMYDQSAGAFQAKSKSTSFPCALDHADAKVYRYL